MRLWTLGLVFVVGCNGGFGDDDDDSGNGNGNGLQDPPFELTAQERCEGFTDDQGNFTEVAGATVYWVGNINFFETGDVDGTERIEIFPNARWQEVNPDHAIRCKVVWDVAGVKGDDTCPTCDYRLTMDAFRSEAASTCHPTFTADAYDEQMLNIQYDVRETCTGDGPCAATITFASGASFATGEANESGLVYAADSQCAFY
jgi:hypothetical protein